MQHFGCVKLSDARTLGRSMLAIRQVMARDVMLSAVQALGDLTLVQFGCLMVLSDGAVRTVGAVSAPRRSRVGSERNRAVATA